MKSVIAWGLSGLLFSGCPSLVTAEAAPAPNASQLNNDNAVSIPQFDIREYRVIGNTVLNERQIDEAVYSLLGTGKNLNDVEAARAALEKAYHDHGFGSVYVDIPEQSVESDGVVRLHVTEGRLSHVAVRGARYVSGRQIRSAVSAAAVNTVPNLPELQRQINEVTAVDSRDRTVVPVLKAGTSPGTVDLSMNVQDKLPFHGSFEINNQRASETAPLRAQAAMEYDNMFGRFDRAALQYQWSPQKPSQVGVFSANYFAHLNDDGDLLAVSFLNSSSSVATVGDIGVIGKGKAYGLQLIRPLTSVSTDESSWSTSQLTIGLEHKNYSQNIVVGRTNSLSTPIKYTTISTVYGYSTQFHSRLWLTSLGVTAGIPALSNSPSKFDNKCFECRPNFFVAHVDSTVRQNLPKGFSALLQVGAQLAVDPLISNEQMAIGGAHSVRGYFEAEELGDSGLHSSLEIRGADLLPKGWRLITVPMVFFDYARLSDRRPLPDQPGSFYLASWGVGVELNLLNQLNGSLSWADPLTSTGSTKTHQPRLQFVVHSSW